MKQNLSKKTGLKSKNIGQKTTKARQKNVILEFFFEKTVKKDSDLDIVVIGAKDQNKIKSIVRRFSREVNVEFSTWLGFEKALKDKNNLAFEIKNNHLIYGNVLKVVNIYSK